MKTHFLILLYFIGSMSAFAFAGQGTTGLAHASCRRSGAAGRLRRRETILAAALNQGSQLRADTTSATESCCIHSDRFIIRKADIRRRSCATNKRSSFGNGSVLKIVFRHYNGSLPGGSLP